VLLVLASVLIEGANAVVLVVVRIQLEIHGVADIVGYHSVVRVSHRGGRGGLTSGDVWGGPARGWGDGSPVQHLIDSGQYSKPFSWQKQF